jgi:AraC family transcriptional regulator
MPEANHPGQLLRGGEFFSRVESRLHTGEVLLSELRQPSSRNVPRHEHELAYITVVLGGDYLEGDHGKLADMRPFTAAFNPSGTRHATVIGPAGAQLFTIELRQRHAHELGARLPEQTTFDRGSGALLWPGLRLYSAFKTQTADPLLLESHVLELLGALDGRGRASEGHLTVETPAPRWFPLVRERLHEEFRENLRMKDLADDAGVHPVHLARVFRRIEKQTPGDYLQGLRVRQACCLLREREYPLALIAAECGFADQSHLTRVFRKLAGTTPGRFRGALAA